MSIKQAIEALESCDPGDYSTGHVIHPSYDEEKVNAALTALRSMPQGEPVAWFELNESLDAWFLSYSFNPKAKTRPLYATPHTEAVRMSEAWQPIETAPKDGRTLLLGYFNSAGKWRTLRGQWMSQNYIDEYWEDPEGVDPWWFETAVEADEVPNCWATEPTHWQPLPPPPIERAVLRGGEK